MAEGGGVELGGLLEGGCLWNDGGMSLLLRWHSLP